MISMARSLLDGMGLAGFRSIANIFFYKSALSIIFSLSSFHGLVLWINNINYLYSFNFLQAILNMFYLK